MDFSFGGLMAALVVSSVGFGLFLYGKKQQRLPQLTVGLVLMVVPYLGGEPLVVWGLGAGLVFALFLAVRAGL